jgi:tagatose 6-phosphate kinase
MIAVAGLNSAIDKLLEIETMTPGRVLRAHEARSWPGGKGVHVALCAAALRESVQLTGFVDDLHREWFQAWLHARDVAFHPIHTRGPIRTCVAIRESAGRITEILEPGPALSSDVRDVAVRTAVDLCGTARIAVLTGSLPPSMPDTTYRDLVAALARTRTIVDASGELLRHAIAGCPFAIKPNRAEAEALTGTRIDSPAAAAVAARALVQSGVHLAIVSLGAEGAVACWEDRACHVLAPAVDVLNSVGAGDCLVGGLAAALARDANIVDALRLGVAAGTAKVLSSDTGGVRRADIDDVLPATRVTWL